VTLSFIKPTNAIDETGTFSRSQIY